MELLPAERDVRIEHRRIAINERTIAEHDATLIACEEANASALIERLPFKAVWRRLYAENAGREPVSLLNARLGPDAKQIVIAFAKADASAFSRLTLAARAWKALQPPPDARVLFGAVGFEADASSAILEALASAALAASAPMPTLKSTSPKVMSPKAITLAAEHLASDLTRTVAMDRGNHLARWLTTLPPNVLDVRSYRRALQQLAARMKWTYSFTDEAALKRHGAGAFLAVTRANEHREAGIARLRYQSGARAARRLTLIGKGVCFDTGGVNLKPHKSMYQMHEDMQGSAVAVGLLRTLTELRAPFDVDCWLALSENEIGPRAYRPQEVVRAANGVTIQVAHSDAEGRMLLADTLAIAAKEAPDLILDFATLTGACVMALGDRYSGAFTNRPELRERIEAAGRESGERVWPFPMDDDYDSELDSPVADILQCTPDSKADHILAARFLNRFVPKETPWIHIDLAASNRTGGLAHIPTDFTGFGVRFATTLLLDQDVLHSRERARRRSGKLGRRKD